MGEEHEHQLKMLVSEYMRLLDTYERFNGPKRIIYMDDLLTQPEHVLEGLLEFLKVDDAHAGVEQWVQQGDQMQEQIADWCTSLESIEKDCVAPCRNFMKSRRKGPFGALAADMTGHLTLHADTWWSTHPDVKPTTQQLSDEQALEAADEFEQFACVYTDIMETPHLLRKYLLRPGWGARAAQYC